MNNDIARARSIFISAVEDCAPDQWDKFLDDACREDVALRQRVELLLRAHQGEDSFLDRGNDDGAGTTIDRPISERPGMVIGPYKLLQQIGEGGFGVVFLAEQERPVKRRVALKVIKPGMDTREVIARFEAERQALAMMDHPNIAKVLDAGTTGEVGQAVPDTLGSQGQSQAKPDLHFGRPYFVMELVQGVPITEYCDKCNLTTRERLALFITVCQAVQHAHQKGVIHRDIKPTNVLVAIQDGQPAPKIIDFGVAKAINQQLTEHTLMTAYAQIVGTPLYMSPEQAELSPLGVDTRSDIYSLGVLLYELLTSTTPFDKERLQAASYDELRRIIREEEPPPPSARLSTLAADRAATVAEHRRTDTRRLRQAVRGELDWIVMKCLEKDRNRRYESAGGLARDVERYLHDEPVQACPPSASYRLKKFVRRNKIAAAFVMMLLASVAALTASNIQTRQNERRAVTESAKAIATSDLLLAMLDSADPEQAKGSEYTVRELLDEFSAGLGDRLKDQPEAEAAVRLTIGNSYRRLELFKQAQPHLETALQLRRNVFGDAHEKVAESLVALAWNYHGQRNNDRSEALLREALKIYEHGAADPQPVVRALWRLQCALSANGRYEEAVAVAQQALDVAGERPGTEYPEVASVLHGLAQIRLDQRRFPEAEELAKRSVELHRRVHAPQHPETAYALQKLGRALNGQGKFAEAKESLQEALGTFRRNYGPENSGVVSCLTDLKSALEALGDKSALETLAKEEADQALRSDDPEFDLRLAGLLLSNKPGTQKQEARQLIRSAIEGFGKVAVNYPDELNRRLQATQEYIRIAELCAADPDFAPEIDEAHRRFTAELASLLASFPDSTRCQKEVGHRHRGWAQTVQWNPNYVAQAEQHFRKSIKLLDKVSRDEPKQPRIWTFLANNYGLLGDLLWRSGRPEEADDAFGRALEIYEVHAADIAEAPNPYSTSETIDVHYRITNFLTATRREQEAAELIRKVALQAMSETDPNALADRLYYTAVAQLRLGDKAGYRATCKALVDVPFDKLVGLVQSRPIWTPCLAPDALDDPTLPLKLAEEFVKSNSLVEPHFGLYMLGAAQYRAGQYERAAARLEESIAAFPTGSSPVTHSISYPRLLLAMSQWQLGQQDEARRLLAETLPAVEKELESPASGWNRRATLELLRGEAETLIGQEDAKEAVENQSRVSQPQQLKTDD